MENTDLTGIKNIIFDLDGTLIDSSEGVVEATNYALTKLGEKPRLPYEITRFIGYPLDEMFPAFCDAPPAKLKAAFQEKARVSIAASSKLLPGVSKTIAYLHKAGYHLAIATTKFTNHTEAIVKKFGWNSYFSALASGDEVERVKPAPDQILLVLDRLKAPADETVMVGDTVNDIMAAKAAGVRIIAVRSPFGNVDLNRHNPDLFLDDFAQLMNIFSMNHER